MKRKNSQRPEAPAKPGAAREINDRLSVFSLPMLCPDGEMSAGLIPGLPEALPWWARGAPEAPGEAPERAGKPAARNGLLASWRVVAMAAMQMGIL
jgi:hypothetical protein